MKNEAIVDATAVCDMSVISVAVSILNPPDRVSGVLAKAPFDVMQVSGANVSLGRVELKRGGGSSRKRACNPFISAA